MENTTQSCFAWLAGQEPAEDAGANRPAINRRARWQSGDIITVSFVEQADDTLKQRIREAARLWTREKGGPANLTISFVPDSTPTAAIRISFSRPGSWSAIGTSCRKIPADQPTMNFGELTPSTSPEQVRQVVLHEFGHAIGLVHEHQSPAAGIPWNREAIYRELSSYWSRERIDRNIFEAAAAHETNYTAMDPLSIMMYPIKKSWTTDGFSVGLNTDLSATDRQFIRNEYP